MKDGLYLDPFYNNISGGGSLPVFVLGSVKYFVFLVKITPFW